jgi:hypothetical protein
MKRILSLSALFTAFCCNSLYAQETKPEEETELKHYMPLYLDIPAELNVKKGYKEINVGFGYADFKDFSGERALVEYDFAPVRKLGFEIEVPFVFVHNKHEVAAVAPGHEEEDVQVPEEGGATESAMALRVGFNYSFLTLRKAKMTFAGGYFNEIETSPFKEFGKPVFIANVYNPFIAVAKIWGTRLHSMVYAGPAIKQEFHNNETKTAWRLNTILSYRFGKNEKESFAGIECNQSFSSGDKAQLLLRPQVQLQFSEKISLGIIAGIPVQTANNLNGSGFLRFIYRPGL